MAPPFWSRLRAAGTSQVAIVIVAGILALLAGMGGRYIYSNYFIPKQVSYRLCVGIDPKLCPPQTEFVQAIIPESVVAWVNKACAKYKKRETINSEQPNPDCKCSIVQVTCALTF